MFRFVNFFFVGENFANCRPTCREIDNVKEGEILELNIRSRFHLQKNGSIYKINPCIWSRRTNHLKNIQNQCKFV